MRLVISRVNYCGLVCQDGEILFDGLSFNAVARISDERRERVRRAHAQEDVGGAAAAIAGSNGSTRGVPVYV